MEKNNGRSLRAEPAMNQAQGLGHSVAVSNADRPYLYRYEDHEGLFLRLCGHEISLDHLTDAEQTLLLSEPSLSQSNTFALHGCMDHIGSKMGVRFVEMDILKPYPHRAHIDIYGDECRNGDDDLTEDFWPKMHRLVTAECALDEHGDLSTTPSKIRIAEPYLAKAIEARQGGGADAVHESAAACDLPKEQHP